MPHNPDAEELIQRLLSARQNLDHARSAPWGPATIIALVALLVSIVGGLSMYFNGVVTARNLAEYNKEQLGKLESRVTWIEQHATFK